MTPPSLLTRKIPCLCTSSGGSAIFSSSRKRHGRIAKPDNPTKTDVNG